MVSVKLNNRFPIYPIKFHMYTLLIISIALLILLMYTLKNARFGKSTTVRIYSEAYFESCHFEIQLYKIISYLTQKQIVSMIMCDDIKAACGTKHTQQLYIGDVRRY